MEVFFVEEQCEELLLSEADIKELKQHGLYKSPVFLTFKTLLKVFALHSCGGPNASFKDEADGLLSALLTPAQVPASTRQTPRDRSDGRRF